MADLVKKYFQEDLAEAEKGSLSERLLNSPEDSLEFAAMAEAAYGRYGLPEPEWPGNPDDWPRPASGPGVWLWLGLLLLVSAVAVLAWMGQGVKQEEVELALPGAGAVGESSGSPAVDPGATAGTSAQADGGDGGTVPVDRATRPSKPVPGSPASRKPDPAGTAPEPGGTIAQPGRPHTGLAVAVRQDKKGEVTVRVLDADGNEAAFLYKGLLEPGRWVFDWDGRLADGAAAPPGSYHIVVESGGATKRKTVFVRK